MNRRSFLSFLTFAPLAVPAAIAAARASPVSNTTTVAEALKRQVESLDANYMQARRILDEAPTLQNYIDSRRTFLVDELCELSIPYHAPGAV